MLILYIWLASAFLHIKIKPLFREETETIRLFIFVIKLLRVNSRFRSWKATRKLSQWVKKHTQSLGKSRAHTFPIQPTKQNLSQCLYLNPKIFCKDGCTKIMLKADLIWNCQILQNETKVTFLAPKTTLISLNKPNIE